MVFMGKINYLNIDKDIDKTNIEKQVKIYESKFPIVIDNITYNIFGDVDITHANKNCYIYHFNLIDNEGYKYYLNYSNIIAALNTKILLNRFFKRNKYTYDNINLYCALNNIDLHINGDGLPISGASREKMDYFDSNNVIHNVSWNQIQHYSFRYKNNYNEIKQNNKIKRELSKQEVINIVFEMQKRKGSPLNIYDFYPKQKNGVGIRTIRKYWDELWLMQKDLGLKITGKHESILSDEEILKEIIEDNQAKVLATIVEKVGSSPRGIGTKMLIKEDKSFKGTVGGGSVENAVYLKSLELIDSRSSDVEMYNLSNSDASTLGMVCGGKVKVVFEYI